VKFILMSGELERWLISPAFALDVVCEVQSHLLFKLQAFHDLPKELVEKRDRHQAIASGAQACDGR
jgi:hypothetical protein